MTKIETNQNMSRILAEYLVRHGTYDQRQEEDYAYFATKTLGDGRELMVILDSRKKIDEELIMDLHKPRLRIGLSTVRDDQYGYVTEEHSGLTGEFDIFKIIMGLEKSKDSLMVSRVFERENDRSFFIKNLQKRYQGLLFWSYQALSGQQMPEPTAHTQDNPSPCPRSTD